MYITAQQFFPNIHKIVDTGKVPMYVQPNVNEMDTRVNFKINDKI